LAHLAANPHLGDVMPGCGGLRKVRWVDPKRGKGKRGGLRIVYLLVVDPATILLVTVYDKNQTDDLSPQQKRQLAALAKDAKKAIADRKGKGE